MLRQKEKLKQEVIKLQNIKSNNFYPFGVNSNVNKCKCKYSLFAIEQKNTVIK